MRDASFHNALAVIRFTASYHRAVAGLFWILDDAMGEMDDCLGHPFHLAVRAVLRASVNLEICEQESRVSAGDTHPDDMPAEFSNYQE